VKKLAMETK